MLDPKFNLKGEESCCSSLFTVVNHKKITLQKMTRYRCKTKTRLKPQHCLPETHGCQPCLWCLFPAETTSGTGLRREFTWLPGQWTRLLKKATTNGSLNAATSPTAWWRTASPTTNPVLCSPTQSHPAVGQSPAVGQGDAAVAPGQHEQRPRPRWAMLRHNWDPIWQVTGQYAACAACCGILRLFVLLNCWLSSHLMVAKFKSHLDL